MAQRAQAGDGDLDDVASALIDRDPHEAEKAMRVHLDHVAENLLGRL